MGYTLKTGHEREKPPLWLAASPKHDFQAKSKAESSVARPASLVGSNCISGGAETKDARCNAGLTVEPQDP